MVLIIDTATKYLYLALVDNNQVLEEFKKEGKNDHSATLMVEIDNLLKRHNKDINNINKIVVGVGPGSYTGVRIGVIVAKMLAYQKDIKLASISTLKLMSSGYRNREVASVIDARRGDAFATLIKINADQIEEILPDRFGCKNEFLDESHFLTEEVTVNEDELNTDPLVIIENAKEISNEELLPNYLRETEAERNL